MSDDAMLGADVPLCETCACGGVFWHRMVDDRMVWCRRCGALRLVTESHWRIPLDRAGDLPASSIPPAPLDDEPPTIPGTPAAKRH